MQRVYEENEWGKVSKRIITPIMLTEVQQAQINMPAPLQLVMPVFGSEPQFEPEPAWTGPRFSPKFKEFLNRT